MFSAGEGDVYFCFL